MALTLRLRWGCHCGGLEDRCIYEMFYLYDKVANRMVGVIRRAAPTGMISFHRVGLGV